MLVSWTTMSSTTPAPRKQPLLWLCHLSDCHAAAIVSVSSQEKECVAKAVIWCSPALRTYPVDLHSYQEDEVVRMPAAELYFHGHDEERAGEIYFDIYFEDSDGDAS